MFDDIGRRLRRRQGIERNPIYRLAGEVVAGRLPAEAAYEVVEHPRVLGRLADGDLWDLDREAEHLSTAYPDRALVLARLTILAARYKGFDRVLVDCNMRAADLLNRMGDSREQELHLREALHAAERIANVNGQRQALARLARLAFDQGETERARDLLNRQLEAGREDIDTLEDVETAILLGDLARNDGDSVAAREFYHRAARSARRVGHFEGVVDALLRQIVILREEGDGEAALLLLQQAQDAAGRTINTRLQAELAIQAGFLLSEQHQFPQARGQLLSALDLARSMNDIVVECRCLTGLARIEQTGGRLEDAVAHLRSLADLEGRIGNRTAVVRAVLDAAEIQLQMGHAEEAHTSLSSTISTLEELGEGALRGRALGLLGLTYGALDRRSEALECLLGAIQQAQRDEAPRDEARWLIGVGEVLLGFREFEDALASARRAGELASRTGDDRQLAQALSLMGAVSLARGLFRDAEESLQRAVTIARTVGDLGQQLNSLQLLAQAARRAGQPQSAMRYLTQALDVAARAGGPQTRSRLHGQLARLHVSLSELEEAAKHYHSALAEAEEAAELSLAARALRGLAMTEDAIGDVDQAVQHYARAAALYEESGNEPVAAALRYNLGALLADRGALDDADEQVHRALELSTASGDYRTADAARELLHWLRSGSRSNGHEVAPSEDLLLDEFSMGGDARR